ncbi:MAG: hypothetical protein GY757_26670 [bacterium]|nr:hypothetical protein [bacterium]
MTYNLGYLSAMTNNLPVTPEKSLFETNMSTFIELLGKTKPDYIAFQEIDFNSSRSFNINQMKVIAEKAHFKYGASAINWDKRYVPFPYWPPSVNFGKMLSGQALLSRDVILSTERYILERPANNAFYRDAFYIDRLAQVVKIQSGDRVLVIINIHLEAFHRPTREKQALKVLELFRRYNKDFPVILMGDFNCVPPDAKKKNNFIDEPEADFNGDQSIQPFLQESGLKAAELSLFTFPSNKATRKLDYIFYSDDAIELVDLSVPFIDSSDHLPLIMQFRFKQEIQGSGSSDKK